MNFFGLENFDGLGQLLGTQFADTGFQLADSPGGIPLNSAISKKLIDRGCSIDRALTTYQKGEEAGLILWCESETIGPSVAYALVARELADYLVKRKGGFPIEVLDLFSGSGLSARAVASNSQNSIVYCVDKEVSAQHVGAHRVDNIIWLKMDVSDVGKGRVLDQQFDLVCMDPPHGALFEMLFGSLPKVQSIERDIDLIRNVARLTDWLVLYPGHACQFGRAAALRAALRQGGFSEAVFLEIGPEIVIVAWSGKDSEKEHWRTTVDNLVGSLGLVCKSYGWEVREREIENIKCLPSWSAS